MRLFYALTFDDITKSQITRYRDLVADHAVKGRFTREANFHITLSFIGNTNTTQFHELTNVLFELGGCPDSVGALHLGTFQRKSNNLVWLGIEREKELLQLQKQLHVKLAMAGYNPEKRKYTPHITLGRNIVMREKLNELIIEPIVLKISSIALMESKTVGDYPVYEVLEEIICSTNK